MVASRDPLHRFAAVVAVLMLGGASACGGPDAQPADGGADQPQAAAAADDSFDPCALLTAEEVTAAVGWQPTQVKPVKQGGGLGVCDYSTADSLAMPPQKVEVGILKCPYNIPCYEDLPNFGSSQELADYRKKDYEGGMYADAATIAPLEGLGVPALHQDLLGLHSVEMYVGHNRLAYVTTFTDLQTARSLADKVLPRAR